VGNLPRKEKRAKPAYQPITSAQIPRVPLPSGGDVRVIAGRFGETLGPAGTHSPMEMLDVNLPAGQPLSIPLPAHHNAIAVVADGRVGLDDGHAVTGELILFANDGDRLQLTAEADSHLVILAGEPLNEPVVAYGPFVMNTFDEIRQAVFDVQSGKFGPIPD
jgi:quercetin 2,3-dioxygenase